MKRQTIKQIARRFGWAAAVAGSLGLAHPAAAQTPPQKGYRTAPVATGRVAAGTPAQRVAVDNGTLRLVQARVQLAWLADPMTFPYTLSLTAGPQGIQVTGFVPNDGIRQRALKLATQHSGLPVADGLKVHAGQAVRCAAPVSGAALLGEATAALHEAFGDRAAHFQVSADERGRVTVSGPCASAADQLEVVRSLRRAGHCACVVCQLSIGDVPTTVLAQADRAPLVEPAPARQTVVAWNPEKVEPPVELPPAPEVKTESTPPVAETVTAAAPGSPRMTPASFYESPKLASIDALPAMPGKTDGPTPAADPKVKADGEVYETTGEIQWENGPADGKNAVWSSNPDTKNTPADAAKVRDLVRARCGADVREVRVECMGDGRLHITLRMAPGTDRGRVENEIRQIPDVARYARGYFID